MKNYLTTKRAGSSSLVRCVQRFSEKRMEGVVGSSAGRFHPLDDMASHTALHRIDDGESDRLDVTGGRTIVVVPAELS